MAFNKKTLAVAIYLVGLNGCNGGLKNPSSSAASTSSQATNSSTASSSSASSVDNNQSANPLIINEIVAKSADEGYLMGADWIELYNSGSSPINLADYSVADSGSEIITLPAVTLDADSYIVIPAVDKDEPSPPQNSVPFKLGEADSLSLYYQGGLIKSIAWTAGRAPEGTSFGLFDGDYSTLLPTAGAVNQQIPSGSDFVPRGNPVATAPLQISEIVAQSDRPDYFEGSDWIELINTGTSAIDLSDYSLADDSSNLESLPSVILQPGEYIVVVAGSANMVAGVPSVSFGLGREDSISIFYQDQEVDYIPWTSEESKNGRSYGRLDGQLQILYPTPNEVNVAYELFVENKVFEVRIDVAPADWQAMLNAPRDEQYYPANFSMNGAKIDNVGFRIKGQGSLFSIQNSIRYGFKVDTNEYLDQKFMGKKKIVFNQAFADPSLMRDTLAYRLMAKAGVPAPQISYVDLWVGQEHLGVYQMVEMIDDDFIEDHFPEDKNAVGDLYKGELGQRLLWTDANINTYSTGLVLKTNKETIGRSDEGTALINFLDAINNGDAPLAHINTELVIKYLAASVLIGNMDSPIGGTANNFYLYEQRSKGIFTLIPWDYNLSMGQWGNGPATSIGGLGGGFWRWLWAARRRIVKSRL